MGRDSIIEVRNVSKAFGDFKAVDSLSFDVERGEIFGFLGPNGAGKTTTINLLTTLLDPSSGSMRVAGFDVAAEKEKVRENIALISQEGSIDGTLNGWENLYFYGRLYHIDPKLLGERIRSALEFVKLDSKRNINAKYYSGGMRRRLEIAKAFITKPQIIFLDEPTIGLDPQSREAIWEHIVRLRDTEGVTIFLTTHYMEEAEVLCDRVAIMDGGKLLVCDSPKELVKKIGGIDIVSLELEDRAEEFSIILSKSGFTVDGVDGNRVRVRADFLGISEINTKAKKNGFKIMSLLSKRPTLEDVFLHYTGRTLRDEVGADSRQNALMRGMKH